MANIEKLQEEEIKGLKNTSLTNLEDLENLILEGENARIPVEFNLELYDKEQRKMVTHRVSCALKPLTNTEVQNAQRIAYKSTETTLQIEILAKGMYGIEDDKLFSKKLIRRLPTGLVDSLAEQLLELSGVKLDKDDQEKLAERLMGF